VAALRDGAGGARDFVAVEQAAAQVGNDVVPGTVGDAAEAGDAVTAVAGEMARRCAVGLQ
jgi:hypothetical protein